MRMLPTALKAGATRLLSSAIKNSTIRGHKPPSIIFWILKFGPSAEQWTLTLTRRIRQLGIGDGEREREKERERERERERENSTHLRMLLPSNS